MYQHRYETSRFVTASPSDVFAEFDEHERLAAHMMRSSAMMARGATRLDLDQEKGRNVGSKMVLRGRVLGLSPYVEEVVVEYAPPMRKAWETVGEPRLLVIGSYRMEFSRPIVRSVICPLV